jgi:hypothetical protein
MLLFFSLLAVMGNQRSKLKRPPRYLGLGCGWCTPFSKKKEARKYSKQIKTIAPWRRCVASNFSFFYLTLSSVCRRETSSECSATFFWGLARTRHMHALRSFLGVSSFCCFFLLKRGTEGDQRPAHQHTHTHTHMRQHSQPPRLVPMLLPSYLT